MNKREASLRVGAVAQLSPRHTHFANINVAKDVWWLDIPLAKVADEDLPDLDLLHIARVYLKNLNAILGRQVGRTHT